MLAQIQTPGVPGAAVPSGAPSDAIEIDPPDSASEALDLMFETVQSLWTSFLTHLPLIAIGLAILAAGAVVARYAGRATARALDRTRADVMVASLATKLLRATVFFLFVLLALAVAGVSVSAALAGLGIAGLAVAFALQTILENFIAGVLLLIRKPFSAGDQIITGDFEGTVQEIDLRVTKLIDYDGEQILVPNAEVYSNTLVNLTRRGRRRSRAAIAIDYRDDHNAAPRLIREAVAEVDGVRGSPPPEVICTELGDSGVIFEILYWTDPDIGSVVRTRDRVLRAAKDAVEGAGMTIPWPIRTLVVDDRGSGDDRGDGDGAARPRVRADGGDGRGDGPGDGGGDADRAGGDRDATTADA